MLLSFDLIYSVAHGEVNAMDKTPMYEMSLTFVCLGFGVGEAIFSIGICPEILIDCCQFLVFDLLFSLLILA